MQYISQLLERPAQLAYLAGANNYTWLHFRSGERRLLAKPLTFFEERLSGFVRIHKTALINPDYVASVQPPPRPKAPGSVRMQNGTELPVSRRRWREVVHLLQTDPVDASPAVALAPEPAQIDSFVPYAPPALRVLAVMTDDAGRQTRQCIGQLRLGCALQHVEVGIELATALLLGPPDEWPVLIILDARTRRADRILTLRALKSHDRLRAIPVVWLAAPGDDTVQAYNLDANSAVVIGKDSASFTRAIEQLCRYWLMLVQLPPETGPA